MACASLSIKFAFCSAVLPSHMETLITGIASLLFRPHGTRGANLDAALAVNALGMVNDYLGFLELNAADRADAHAAAAITALAGNVLDFFGHEIPPKQYLF